MRFASFSPTSATVIAIAALLVACSTAVKQPPPKKAEPVRMVRVLPANGSAPAAKGNPAKSANVPYDYIIAAVQNIRLNTPPRPIVSRYGMRCRGQDRECGTQVPQKTWVGFTSNLRIGYNGDRITATIATYQKGNYAGLLQKLGQRYGKGISKYTPANTMIPFSVTTHVWVYGKTTITLSKTGAGKDINGRAIPEAFTLYLENDR